MGASESKMSVASTPKIDLSQRPKAARVSRLADPRSPSCVIDRTPIQVGVAYSPLPVVESVGPAFVDPCSPTPGVTRTPLKVSVTSLARRLSTFFLNDVKSGDSVSPLPLVSFTKHHRLPNGNQQNDAGPRNPLLPLVKSQNSSTLIRHTDAVSTPVLCSPSEAYGSMCSSPFVLIGGTQVEVDAETSLEEAEDALLLGASSLRKELSLSLLACREGIYSSSLEEHPLTPPPAESQANEDHSCALFSVPPQSRESETSTPVVEAVVTSETVEDPSQTSEEQLDAALLESSHEQPEESKPPTPQPAVAPSKSSPVTDTQVETVQSSIRCLKFDTRSPSQAIFKPQWLGVGFGTTGVRARGVQACGKTSMSSPLSTKNTATNENNNMVVRAKQRPREKFLIGEGRSPLQILREANSPRDRNSQMKLKVSTPEKQRFSQMDRRALILSLNKENE